MIGGALLAGLDALPHSRGSERQVRPTEERSPVVQLGAPVRRARGSPSCLQAEARSARRVLHPSGWSNASVFAALRMGVCHRLSDAATGDPVLVGPPR
jgi:hypothetical protein